MLSHPGSQAGARMVLLSPPLVHPNVLPARLAPVVILRIVPVVPIGVALEVPASPVLPHAARYLADHFSTKFAPIPIVIGIVCALEVVDDMRRRSLLDTSTPATCHLVLRPGVTTQSMYGLYMCPNLFRRSRFHTARPAA
ncbi:hypothetical protein DAEQUDRAFT_732152 [Daedalea quercina L-15889]|uniref:Uncharacterized protein n=1 Tax=Daedalea quercina L-15889 TaxID=1314783 RepID=A0A165LUD0_9APHY|nr:hypothetical protein DAEQUDRAFT_732152 [Daedalea quercina L-15889]